MGLRRVLPSHKLPAPGWSGDRAPGPVRHRALAGTWSAPDMRQVKVGRYPVLLARLPSGQPVAFATNCPHQGTPLQHATFYEGHLRCPQHNYVYDLHSGQNILPTRDARPEALWRLKPGHLRIHRVEERDGWIWVDDRPQPPPPAYDPAVQRPALPGQAPATPATAAPSGPVRHPAQTLTVDLGADVDLQLPTRPLPGHLWRVELQGDCVALLGQSFHPGEQAHYRVRMATRGPGEATVRCQYAQPWAAIPKEVRTFTIRVRARA